MAATDEISIKGNTFHSVLKCLHAWKGAEVVERVKSDVGGDLGQALKVGTLMPPNWYPVAWYRDLYDTILAVAGGGEETIRHLGRASTAMDVNGAYRLIMKVIGTERVFGQSTRMLGQYYSGVRCRVKESHRGKAIVAYEGFRGFNRLLWLELLASGGMVLESAGAQNVQQTVLRGGIDQISDMELLVTWE